MRIPFLATMLFLTACGGAQNNSHRPCLVEKGCPRPAEIPQCKTNIEAIPARRVLLHADDYLGRTIAVSGAIGRRGGVCTLLGCPGECCNSCYSQTTLDSVGIWAPGFRCRGDESLICCTPPTDGSQIVVSGLFVEVVNKEVVGHSGLRFENASYCRADHSRPSEKQKSAEALANSKAEQKTHRKSPIQTELEVIAECFENAVHVLQSEPAPNDFLHLFLGKAAKLDRKKEFELPLHCILLSLNGFKKPLRVSSGEEVNYEITEQSHDDNISGHSEDVTTYKFTAGDRPEKVFRKITRSHGKKPEEELGH